MSEQERRSGSTPDDWCAGGPRREESCSSARIAPSRRTASTVARKKDQRHAAQTDQQRETQAAGGIIGSSRGVGLWPFGSNGAVHLALVYREGGVQQPDQSAVLRTTSRCLGTQSSQWRLWDGERFNTNLELEVVSTMKFEFFKGRRWLATVSLAAAARCNRFLRVTGSDRGQIALRESGANHQDGHALRGGCRPRVFGRREARSAGRGQHFIFESGEANGDGRARRASILSSASSSAMTFRASDSTYRRSEARKLSDRASSSARRATF